MNKQLVQNLVKAYNDYHNDEMIHILVETKKRTYNCYEALFYGTDKITFKDEDNNLVLLDYEDIIGIKVTEIQNVIQCVTEGEKVKDSVAETVPLSHLLITSTITLYLPTRIPYSNNINNTINVTTITYTTHTVSLILSYLSASYVNNSIYFTILTTTIDTITDTYTSSNV